MSLTFRIQKKRHGSTMMVVDVERDGQPFGQLWTWPTTRTEDHPWHAKPLNGEHKVFWKHSAPLAIRAAEGGGGIKAAKAYMEACAKAQ